MIQCNAEHLTLILKPYISSYKKALEDIYDCYKGWDIVDDEGREEVFKHGLWTARSSSGWTILTHQHRSIIMYAAGQALSLNAYEMENLMVKLRKLK